MTNQDYNNNYYKNKIYYQNTFDEVHIPEELFGKVLQMNKQKKKKINYRIAAAIALLVLCAAAGTSAYAAIKHYKLADFFAQSDTKIPEDAEKLLENNPEQKQVEIPEMSGIETQLSDYVTGKVVESLCDSSSIHCNVAVTPKEAEQVLLIPYHAGSEYVMENIGITGEDKKLSCQKYADKYKKKILYIDADIDQEVPVNMYTENGNKLDSDGTLHFSFTMDNMTGKADIKCSCALTVYEKTAGKMQKKASGELKFTVHDNSSAETVTYVSKQNMDLKSTRCQLDQVTIQKTELGAYVTFDYHTDTKADAETKEILDGITYELVDSNGNTLPGGLSGGGSSTDLGEGKYQCSSNYELEKIPEKIRVKVFDCWTKEVYGYIDMKQK